MKFKSLNFSVWYLKVVIIRSASGGIYEMKITELLGEMVLEDVRQCVWNFMYVSFRDFWPIWFFFIFAKLGRSEVKKVMKSRISLYKLQWETIRKSWDFGTFFTSDRPNITKNENFSNRSKAPSQPILGLQESGFSGRFDHSRWWGTLMNSYPPPLSLSFK